MKKNLKLLTAIREQDRTQRDVSRAAGVPEATLSYAISGRLNLRPTEKARIAEALNRSVADLFKD